LPLIRIVAINGRMDRINKPIIDELQALVTQKGSKQHAAKSLHISAQYLNDILHGRRGVSDKVAKKLGFQWKLEKVSP
jgi:hypothetical protein